MLWRTSGIYLVLEREAERRNVWAHSTENNVIGKNATIGNRSSKFSPMQFLVGTGTMAALTFALLSTATANPKTGARTALEGVVQYGCTDVCFDRFNTCIGQGTPLATCMTRIQQCVYYCMGGGGNGNSAAPVGDKDSVAQSTHLRFYTQ